MRSVAILGGVIWLLLVGTASAQTMAYTAVVSRDDAEVRAGPNENPQLYVTNRLRRGTTVQVVEELGNGWLKIRPPAGSFSWIGTNFVQLVVPNQPNWMVVGSADVSAPVIVGTDFKKEAASQIVSSRLARGAQVTSLGPARVDEQGTWLPIEPPPGECRYLRADAVTRGAGPLVAAAAKPNSPPPVPTGVRITDAEALGMRAAQAEREGNIAVAIDLYTRAGAAAQPNNPELALQANNRAYWLRQGMGVPPQAQVHSTFTPSPLPAGDYRLTATAPNIQLADPVGVHTATTRPGDLGGTQQAALVSTGAGHLRRAGRAVEGRTTYVLDSPQGLPLFYVTAQPGVELEPYVNKNVEMFGTSVYNGELRANYMRVERVQPLP